jgi:transcriptional regulator with PAS, ATPase and Fis domain
MEKDLRRISDEATQVLVNYAWPGNIRELENALERAVVVAETDEIQTGDLPLTIAAHATDLNRDWSLERVKQEHITKVLGLVGGNKKKAAKLLGLDATTLWRKSKTG